MKPAVIVLAAGASQRMGQPKALLRLDGRTLLQWILERALALPDTQVWVTLAQPHGDSIQQELAALGSTLDLQRVHVAWNTAPERGMLSSVQCALSQLPSDRSGALIWPVDLPRVQPTTLQRIVDAAAQGPSLIVPTHGGRGGHPLWLPAERFADALSLPTDLGLRGLRQRHPPRLVSVEDVGILRDIDTPQDWNAEQQQVEGNKQTLSEPRSS